MDNFNVVLITKILGGAVIAGAFACMALIMTSIPRELITAVPVIVLTTLSMILGILLLTISQESDDNA